MADVLAPTQKDVTPPAAGPPLVDLSRLDGAKQVTAAADKPTTGADSAAPLTQLQLTDNSKPASAPVLVADNAAPTTVTVRPADSGAQVAPAKVPESQSGAVSASDCDKSTACTFTPTTDRDKAKPWWDARSQLVDTKPEVDSNCLYTVKFGDDLSTIAQRQLHAEGKAVKRGITESRTRQTCGLK